MFFPLPPEMVPDMDEPETVAVIVNVPLETVVETVTVFPEIVPDNMF